MFVLVLIGCDSTGRNPGNPGPPHLPTGDLSGLIFDLSTPNQQPGNMGDMSTVGTGCADPKACYTVYAHADHMLYKIDLMAKTLSTVGPFNAPMVSVTRSGMTVMEEDTITDLAVSPQDVIYVISKTQLYTADANTGHVTLVGPVTACGGTFAVALTFTNDGKLYAGDHSGAFCKIDLATNPPTVTPVGTGKLSGGVSLSGDIVAIGDGTMYGSATLASDTTTKTNNVLVKIDPATGNTTVIGPTGSKNLFGLSFALGKVFGFTHDCTGNVVIIDPKTGAGTTFNAFQDPTPNCLEKNNNGTGISFGGAGVNAMVAPGPIS